jgi:hypothetical protein
MFTKAQNVDFFTEQEKQMALPNELQFLAKALICCAPRQLLTHHFRGPSFEENENVAPLP